MIRLLIIAGLVYFGYRKLKFWALESNRNNSSKTDEIVNDVMVQDPYCKTYFPKRESIILNIKGKDLYFCSKECKEKYISMHLNNKQEDK